MLTFHCEFRDIKELYIREVYEELYTRYVMEYPYLIITGNPGVGKSYFSLYVLYRLRKEISHPVIVYVSVPGSLVVLFDGDDVSVENDEKKWSGLLDQKETIYIFDAGTQSQKVPLVRKARTYIFSSPSVRNYQDFEKERVFGDGGGGFKIYMPTWSWDEISTLCTIKKSESAKAKERFDHWGGIARYIFRRGEVPKHSEYDELNSAISNCSSDKIISMATGLHNGDIKENSHKMLHLRPMTKLEDGQVDYTTTQVFFASNYVADRVFEMYQEKSEHALIEVLKICKDNWVNGIRGQLFERFVHSRFVSRSEHEYDAKCLEPGHSRYNKVEQKRFGQLKEVHLESAEELTPDKIKPGLYLKPVSQNFESIDSIIPPKIGLQITVAGSHPVKIKGLQRIVQSLSCTKQKPLQLYFVVPREEFGNYEKQKYVDNTKKNRAKKTQEHFDGVEQWVLCMDYT